MYRPHGEKATRTTNLEDLNVCTGREVIRSVRIVLDISIRLDSSRCVPAWGTTMV